MRILLVDDHEIVRHGVKQLLAEQFPEAEFGEAVCTAEALAQLERHEWHIVLLDIHIPDRTPGRAARNGLDLIPEVRRLQPRAQILVLSMYPEEEFAVRAFKLGAAGYLTKASAADELLVAVNKLRSGGRYVSAALAERLASAIGSPQAPHEALSPRELEVLRLVAAGRTAREIATDLGLSEKTIGTYRARIADKLGASTNVELTRYAFKHGLVD